MTVAIVGPTCVGKTSVSIALARSLHAEIVSVDSRQIYREISIGTAKPSDEELAAVPHHFIGERSLNEPIAAGEFASQARSRIADIETRGKHVLLVGGSTLYFHALLFGLDSVPPSDPDVRKRLQAELDSEGLSVLASKLAEIDPLSYDRIDRENPRRVLRALEVYEMTGQSLSSLQTGSRKVARDARIIAFARNRDDLYRRINRRATAMVADGLVDEVKVLLEAGFSPNLQALQTIGYKEVFQFLSGQFDKDSMIDLISRNTRRYAKRQLTWFRRYKDVHWIEIGEKEDLESVCSRVIDLIGLGPTIP